jgi:hypothetical protein
MASIITWQKLCLPLSNLNITAPMSKTAFFLTDGLSGAFQEDKLVNGPM